MVTNKNKFEIERVIAETNKRYGYKLYLNSFARKSANRFSFTLRSPSKIDGAKVNPLTGRNIAAAGWRAHGNFFDTFMDMYPDAIIRTHSAFIRVENGKVVGNWQDWVVYPYYNIHASECDY